MARKDRMQLHERNGVTVLDMGRIEIWDGADLSLLRDTLTELFEDHGCRSLGVEMTYVKYVPSGFFGMMFDWLEKGCAIHLYSPLPHVQEMLWFRQFFDHLEDGCHKLLAEPKFNMSATPTIARITPPWKTTEKTPAAIDGRSRQVVAP